MTAHRPTLDELRKLAAEADAHKGPRLDVGSMTHDERIAWLRSQSTPGRARDPGLTMAWVMFGLALIPYIGIAAIIW